MTRLSSEFVQQLARWRGEAPAVSLYLDVRVKAPASVDECRQRFEALVKAEAVRLERDFTSEESEQIDRIRAHMHGDFMVPGAIAIAVFAGKDIWETVEIPVAVGDLFVVNQTPAIRHLERTIDENEPLGMLISDRQYARMVKIDMWGIVDRHEIQSPLPRHDDDGGILEKDRVKTRTATAAAAHLKRAAQEMFEFSKRHSFGRLIISAPEDIRPELERHLHAYLKAKLVGRVSIEVRSGDDKICEAARGAATQAERESESHNVDRLRSGNNAVSGIEEVLDAVFDRRVEMLLVSDGFTMEGWRCGDCRRIATLGPNCPACGNTMHKVHDVVEEAVEDALNQSFKVDFCIDNADLDVVGRIGALLRF